MSKNFKIVAILSILASCQTVDLTPADPDFTATYRGDYRAIADCATPGFRRLPDWSRIDLLTQGKIEFVKGNGTSTLGIITLSAAGPNQTRVVSRIPHAIYGADFYAKMHRPIFEKCAS